MSGLFSRASETEIPELFRRASETEIPALFRRASIYISELCFRSANFNLSTQVLSIKIRHHKLLVVGHCW